MSVSRMTANFHGSGNFLYAKFCQIYLQDMYILEKKIDPFEYDKFTKLSYFTVRKSENFWRGVWTNMCIKQIIMRFMKTKGGLTRDRGTD